MRIIKPTYENAVMVKDETRVIRRTTEKDEIEELKKRLKKLPEITIEPPPPPK
jgi:hypothetical protein